MSPSNYVILLTTIKYDFYLSSYHNFLASSGSTGFSFFLSFFLNTRFIFCRGILSTASRDYFDIFT